MFVIIPSVFLHTRLLVSNLTLHLVTIGFTIRLCIVLSPELKTQKKPIPLKINNYISINILFAEL